MSCLGVLFSLDDQLVEKIKSFKEDEDRLEYLQETVEETFFGEHPQWVAELDKSWDALHRSLTDGKLEWSNGNYPLNLVILGGDRIYEGLDYIMTLKTPQQVKDIYKSLTSISKETFKHAYFKIDKREYEDFSPEDFEYTWEWFYPSLAFWKLAAEEGRYVLFTVDQ